MGFLGIFGRSKEESAVSGLSPLTAILSHLDPKTRFIFMESEIVKDKLLHGRASINEYKAACIKAMHFCLPLEGEEDKNAAKAILAFYLHTNYNKLASDAFANFIEARGLNKDNIAAHRADTAKAAADVNILSNLHISTGVDDPWHMTLKRIRAKYGLSEEQFEELVAFIFQTMNMTEAAGEKIKVPKTAFVVSMIPFVASLSPIIAAGGNFRANLTSIFTAKKTDKAALKEKIAQSADVTVLIVRSDKERDALIKQLADQKASKYAIIMLHADNQFELTSPLITRDNATQLKLTLMDARKKIFTYFAPLLKDLPPEERLGFMAVLESQAASTIIGKLAKPCEASVIVPLSITVATFLPVSWAILASSAAVLITSHVLANGAFWTYKYRKDIGNMKFLLNINKFLRPTNSAIPS